MDGIMNDKSSKKNFLILSESRDDNWNSVIKDALCSFGNLEFALNKEAVHAVQHKNFDLIILDASTVKDVSSLLNDIRSQKSDMRIIVASLILDWRQAREVFKAGAADYVRKTMDKRQVLSSVRDLL